MKKLVLFSIDSSDAKIKAALEEMATTLDSGIEDVFVVNNNKEDIKTLLITKFGIKDLIAITNDKCDQPSRISTKDLIAIANTVKTAIIEVSAEIKACNNVYNALYEKCNTILNDLFKEVNSFGMGFLKKEDIETLKKGLAEEACCNLLIASYGANRINDLKHYVYYMQHGKDF